MFGWPEAQFSWTGGLSILNVVLPDRNNMSTFAVCFAATALFVWSTIINALYVGHSLHVNRFQLIWPLKLLRWQVTLIKTAAFIPAAEILATGAMCNDTGWFGDVRTDCGELPNVLLSVLSIVTLCLLVPFALMMAVVYYEDNPRYVR